MTTNESLDIMVFKPTFEEFKNFPEYIKFIESKGAHRAGIAKVIPPVEWHAARRYNMKRIGELDIEAPVSQTVTGHQGLYQLFNVQKKSMKVKELKELAESDKYKGPGSSDLDKAERSYWKNITFNPPIYGADVPGTIYDKGVKYWNINSLGTILDAINTENKVQILGVNTAYLYFGMWRASFPWHTEDMDLYSINYLHFGEAKSWYAVPPEHGSRLETLAKGFFSGSFQDCPEFMRHKMTMISPQVLKKFSIPVRKMTQYEGEFMITFPYGYHAGYNHGFNCAESTNFASERWINFGKKAKYCLCKRDSVKIEMDMFIQKYQPDEWEKLRLGISRSKQNKPTKTPIKRKSAARASYASELKQSTTKESENNDSGDGEEQNDYNSSSGEESEEITDTGSDTEQSEDEDKEKADKKLVKSRKTASVRTTSTVIKKRTTLRNSTRQKQMNYTKRHLVHKEEGKHEAKENSEIEVKVQHDSRGNIKHITSPLKSFTKSVWKTAPFNKSKEVAFNRLLATTEVKCAVCVYFSKHDAEHLFNGTAQTDKQVQRHSLDVLKNGRLLTTELCFTMNYTEETSMETAFHIMFGEPQTEELRLLTCDVCHVAVHSRCYGVTLDDCSKSNKWLCDKCYYLQQRRRRNNTVVNKEEIIDVSYETQTEVPISVCLFASPSKKPLTINKLNILDDSLPLKNESFSSDTIFDVSGLSKEPVIDRSEACGSISSNHPKHFCDSAENDVCTLRSVTNGRAHRDLDKNQFNCQESSALYDLQTADDINEVHLKEFDKQHSGGETLFCDEENRYYVEHSYSSVQCVDNDTSVMLAGDVNENSFSPSPPLSTKAELFNGEELNVKSPCVDIMDERTPGVVSLKDEVNSTVGDSNDITCCLCMLRGGALKRTTDGEWCHVICAIGIPEVFFEDKKHRSKINVSKLNPARKKLNCVYCNENRSNLSVDRGACVQCLCGKCAAPFHVTCSFHQGIPLYLGDWPVLIETLCSKHVKKKALKIEKRELPGVAMGDMVIAKHKNGRYYKSRVLDVNNLLYYKVIFEDKSFCFDLPPEDIQGIDARSNILVDGEVVNILWPDKITYRAEVAGHWYDAFCQVRFEDGSILNVKRSDLYAENEEIPKRIRSKVSYASETANKLYFAESLRTGPKRPRIGTRKCASVHKKL